MYSGTALKLWGVGWRRISVRVWDVRRSWRETEAIESGVDMEEIAKKISEMMRGMRRKKTEIRVTASCHLA